MELVKKILLFSSDEGDIVFDPFLGSGTVAVVAKMLGRHYLGFEIVPEYYDFAKERISNLDSRTLVSLLSINTFEQR